MSQTTSTIGPSLAAATRPRAMPQAICTALRLVCREAYQTHRQTGTINAFTLPDQAVRASPDRRTTDRIARGRGAPPRITRPTRVTPATPASQVAWNRTGSGSASVGSQTAPVVGGERIGTDQKGGLSAGAGRWPAASVYGRPVSASRSAAPT